MPAVTLLLQCCRGWLGNWIMAFSVLAALYCFIGLFLAILPLCPLVVCLPDFSSQSTFIMLVWPWGRHHQQHQHQQFLGDRRICGVRCLALTSGTHQLTNSLQQIQAVVPWSNQSPETLRSRGGVRGGSWHCRCSLQPGSSEAFVGDCPDWMSPL